MQPLFSASRLSPRLTSMADDHPQRMGQPRHACCTLTRLGLTALALSLPFGLLSPAQAADPPKRKPGLWQIEVMMEGMPQMGPVQHCIDARTDDLAQQPMGERQQCSKTEIKTQGNRVTVHSVCQIEGSVATTDGVFTGAFDSSYQGEMHTRFKPPLEGMSETRMKQRARWLGPCKPGQKPGDVLMPGMGAMGGGAVNLEQLMNDPKMQEMMRRGQ